MSLRLAKAHIIEEEYADTIIALDRFIQATRDSGYKGTGSAIAELVDNALQAGASSLSISIISDPAALDGLLMIEVADNGSGMDAKTLQQALRFGGSSRFNNRQGLGRYGMGLPNSSLSQARRVEVYSWRSRRSAICTFLDLDEIVEGRMTRVPAPVRTAIPKVASQLDCDSGTLVRWLRCDRLEFRRPTTLANKLRLFLGRVFRHFVWNGIRIAVNGELVQPIDPLFLHNKSLTRGGQPVGEPLQYDIHIPLPDGRGTASGRVTVRFSELPVEEWHNLSNEEKQRLGITKGAGVSVVRAKREIDYGWFLFGDKRKENYDDWWRCEVQFDPGLDEVFGITHTKQQIRPTHDLIEALVPDMEAMAKTLNRRVRQSHERVKITAKAANSEAVAGAKDHRLPPIPSIRITPEMRRAFEVLERRHPRLTAATESESSSARVRYSIVIGENDNLRFFTTFYRDGQLVVALNTDHPFFRKIYAPLCEREDPDHFALRQQVDLLLLAAARAEVSSGTGSRQFLDTWSDVIATFLQ